MIVPNPYGSGKSSNYKWQRKFIFLKKINGRWIFCRYVYRGGPFWNDTVLGTLRIEYEYALNDFELIQRSSEE